MERGSMRRDEWTLLSARTGCGWVGGTLGAIDAREAAEERAGVRGPEVQARAVSVRVRPCPQRANTVQSVSVADALR